MVIASISYTVAGGKLSRPKSNELEGGRSKVREPLYSSVLCCLDYRTCEFCTRLLFKSRLAVIKICLLNEGVKISFLSWKLLGRLHGGRWKRAAGGRRLGE